MTSEKDEEGQLKEALMAIELINSQLDAIAREQEILQMNMMEHERAKVTLDTIKDQKKGDELMVPIGADTYISCSILNTKMSQVNVGAGVSMEKSIPDSIDILEKRMEKIRETQKKLMEVDHNYRQQLDAITQRAQSLQSELSME